MQREREHEIESQSGQPVVRTNTCIAAHNDTVRSLSAFPITLTDESAIAAAAMIGESRIPKKG
jgi:hypothetical protein